MSEVQVGFPVIEDSWTGTTAASDSTGVTVFTAIVRPVKRTTGVRIMRVVLLNRIASWLRGHTLAEAAPYVSGWTEPVKPKPPDADAIDTMVDSLKARIGSGSAKDDAYLEAAIFCVQAWAQVPTAKQP
jgi:hypothetical protein